MLKNSFYLLLLPVIIFTIWYITTTIGGVSPVIFHLFRKHGIL